MGRKDSAVKEKAADFIIELSGRKNIINLSVFIILFIGYALTFMVPKFYGATDAYVGVFVFLMYGILFLNNVDFIKLIKDKDKELIILVVLLFITGINLIIVKSGLGAFFVAADFVLAFYLSKWIKLNRAQIGVISGCYMLLLVYWFFVAYPKLFADYAYYGYNTNTAATFTIFTLLCAFILPELLYEKYNIMGLVMTILMVKGIQLALWHRARGAFIMLLVFMAFKFIIPKKWLLNKKLYTVIWILATVGSLLFVGLYVVVGATGVNFRLPFFYKDIFSGRDAIWLEFFNLFAKKPLTGIGTNVVIESFFEFNVHNAMYNFLVIDGIIVFIGILYFVFKRAQGIFAAIRNNKLAMCGFACLIAVFFESFFDVDLIWADYALNVLFLVCVASYGMNKSDN